MLSVRLKITEAFALAYQTTEEIPILLAVSQSQNLWLKSKTAEWMLIALLFRFVTSQVAGTDV
jgi:hypothetical protein